MCFTAEGAGTEDGTETLARAGKERGQTPLQREAVARKERRSQVRCLAGLETVNIPEG